MHGCNRTIASICLIIFWYQKKVTFTHRLFTTQSYSMNSKKNVRQSSTASQHTKHNGQVFDFGRTGEDSNKSNEVSCAAPD